MFTLNCISLIDEPLVETYMNKFTRLGYCVTASNSFSEIEQEKNVDGFVIFEENLSNISEICKCMIEWKKQSEALIWIILSGQEPFTKMIYLQVGADAVFTYESEIEENILTISNALKRYKSAKKLRQVKQSVEDNKLLRLNSMNLSAIIDGSKEVPLTRIEYKIMELLMQNPNIAISYQEICKEIWDSECDQNKFRVSNVIFHLRKKLEDNPIEPRFIKTIRSKGYLINV
ncbi:winged helix-turn-helix domain-containing protein [Candidatus Enterococcus clewellii]|uniref:OmpR/PhoB-type domain-containing protein n=2 Tax=Candidatus Enterococcus clewellii TaxID=1834193 RepID=A0AAQ3VZT9_9ENTE